MDAALWQLCRYRHNCHATGHPKRLDRYDGMSNSFGEIQYSKEELVAELGSAFLGGIANLDPDIRNSAAYIRGWASALRDNQKWIMWAAARAEKAANYILGTEQKIVDEEAEAEKLKNKKKKNTQPQQTRLF